MNVFTIAVFISIICGIYGAVPAGFRGDVGLTLRLGNRAPMCYDQQVINDQYFDKSFICHDTMAYPKAEIDYAIRQPGNREYYNYMQMAKQCINEDNFFTERKNIDNSYSYECVCNSQRQLITAVYYHTQICHVVDFQQQKIYHANCNGTCNLSYGSIEGYFCVNRGWIERSFLVYCEANTEAWTTYSHNMQFNQQPIGGFYYMNQRLPSYCGCRGYFGCGSVPVPAII